MIIELIKKSVDGLIHFSEISFPYEVHSLESQSSDIEIYLRKISQRSRDADLFKVTIEDFFRDQIYVRDSLIGIDQDRADRIQDLISLLKKKLTKAIVYKIGLIHVNVYIVGQYKDMHIIISTEIVESI